MAHSNRHDTAGFAAAETESSVKSPHKFLAGFLGLFEDSYQG